MQRRTGVALFCRDVELKLALVAALGAPETSHDWCVVPAERRAGIPERPELVSPKALPRRRSLHSRAGQFALLHALAHIEFNAINLALDAAYGFAGLPTAYYADWIRIAQEEAFHFGLLRGLLQARGGDYGDLPAHGGLWEMAEETMEDVLVRMALVPRLLEARGLDVTPGIRARLAAAHAVDAAVVLERIEADEVGHVATGSLWFRTICGQRNLDPETAFFSLLARHYRGRISVPLAREQRLKAGFSPAELEFLENRSGTGEGE